MVFFFYISSVCSALFACCSTQIALVLALKEASNTLNAALRLLCFSRFLQSGSPCSRHFLWEVLAFPFSHFALHYFFGLTTYFIPHSWEVTSYSKKTKNQAAIRVHDADHIIHMLTPGKTAIRQRCLLMGAASEWRGDEDEYEKAEKQRWRSI